MPEFTYHGRNQRGELVQGKRIANSKEVLATDLINDGIIPVDITETKVGVHLSELKKLFSERKISSDDIAIFCRQMYSLYSAGIPIASAMLRLSETANNYHLALALHDIAQNLSAGQNLATCMQAHADIFPNLVIKLVQVGEQSARLDEAFAAAADYAELESATIRRVKGVLRYPMFVISAIIIAVTIINIFVIPVFAKIFVRFNAELPLPTRILLNTSSFIVNHWLLLLSSILIVIFLIRNYLKTPAGRLNWDRKQLKIPLIGKILMMIVLSRFAKSFAIMVRAGLPLTESIQLAGETTNNTYASQRISLMKESVEHGESVTIAAVNANLFSPLILQMLAVGEETGNLSNMLDEANKFYEREVEHLIKNLGERMEPVLLIAVAGMVLMLALGVFLPMWNMISIIK